MKRCCALALALLLAMGCIPWGAAADAQEVTILFTHDLHSHFLPQRAEDGGESGGYARLKTAIDAEKAAHPDALLVDGGDFSIGSLIQTLYTTQAAELRTMGALGYDAATIGNHEFDHTGLGFAQMLNAAADARDAAWAALDEAQPDQPGPLEVFQELYGPATFFFPALLTANYTPAPDNPDRTYIQEAMDRYGMAETQFIERGGVSFGIFGLMGQDSHDCAPTSGFVLEDAVLAAERCVETLQAQGADVIVCLSHSGTNENPKRSEDELLAKAVDGIDVIISGHTHTTLTEPLVVNDTYLVSAGPYCENLGSLTLRKDSSGTKTLVDYHLTPIDETLPEAPDINALVEAWKAQVGETYLDRYGFTYDQVLTTAEFDLSTPAPGIQQGNNLGNLAADAFLWAAERLEASAPNVQTVSVTAAGVLRAPLHAGEITVSQAFDVLSMGVGADGTSGFPLVGVYLTGKELKAAAEVDASVTPIMPEAQLYLGGMEYAFNTHRMFFDRVMAARLYEPFAGSEAFSDLKDDQLYRVVTGMYSAQMLGTVKAKSLGLLSLEPKMADGTPVRDFNDCILYDAAGNEIKEWYALASYLESFGEEGVPEQYANESGDGRKQVSQSWNVVELMKNPGWTTLAVLAVVILTVVLAALLTRRVLRRRR